MFQTIRVMNNSLNILEVEFEYCFVDKIQIFFGNGDKYLSHNLFKACFFVIF